MKTKEFGEVVFITRDESPEGLLLREDRSGVMLEKYYREQGTLKSYVLTDFPDYRLRSQPELGRCLAFARAYAESSEEPIYVEIWEARSTPESLDFQKENNLLDADYDECLKIEVEHIAKILQQ